MGKWAKIARSVILAGLLLAPWGHTEGGQTPREESPSGLRISVLFDNVPFAAGMETAWGFAAAIEGLGKTLLFDTGGDGGLLLANMERMGIDPRKIDAVFLSHVHGDHTGGLAAFLRRNSDVTVYMPASFPHELQVAVAKGGARVVLVTDATNLFDAAYSSGVMGDAPQEQALILDTPLGLVILTGCAHPGIVAIVRKAQRRHGKPVRLLMGGFHLLRQSRSHIRSTIGALKALGVAQVAPTHCTGALAVGLLRDGWGRDFLESGCGAVIDLAP